MASSACSLDWIQYAAPERDVACRRRTSRATRRPHERATTPTRLSKGRWRDALLAQWRRNEASSRCETLRSPLRRLTISSSAASVASPLQRVVRRQGAAANHRPPPTKKKRSAVCSSTARATRCAAPRRALPLRDTAAASERNGVLCCSLAASGKRRMGRRSQPARTQLRIEFDSLERFPGKP